MQQAPTTRVTPATQPGQPPGGMDCIGLVGEVARKLRGPEPWDHDDGHGATVSVRHAEVFRYADGAAVLRIAEGGRERYAAALITPAAALDLARAVYRACDVEWPLTVDRPDPGADDHVGTTLGTVGWGTGQIRFAALLDPNRPGGMARVHILDREQARHIAAALLLAAEQVEAESEPDPAEVEALMEAAGLGPADARAVLAAGYERRRP